MPRATRTTPLLTRYGVSGEAALSDVTLAATLKMQCEAHPKPDPNPNPNPSPNPNPNPDPNPDPPP